MTKNATANSAAFTSNPFWAFCAPGQVESLNHAYQEQTERVEHWMHELGALENQWLERVRANTQHAAKLTEDTATYMTQMWNQWQRLTLDATKKFAAMSGLNK